MSPILFFIIFFYLHRYGKNIFTNKFSSSGIYRYFNSSVRRVKIFIYICAYNYVEDPQMIQLLLYVDIAVGNSSFSSFSLTCQNRPCISKLISEWKLYDPISVKSHFDNYSLLFN